MDPLSTTWTTPQAFSANLKKKKKKPTIPQHANLIATSQPFQPYQLSALASMVLAQECQV